MRRYSPFSYQHDFNTIQIIGKYNKHPIAHCMNVIYILFPSRWALLFSVVVDIVVVTVKEIPIAFTSEAYLLYAHKFESAAKSFISWNYGK